MFLFAVLWVARKWLRARRARAKVYVELVATRDGAESERDVKRADPYETLVLRGATGVAKRCVCVYVLRFSSFSIYGHAYVDRNDMCMHA